MAEVTINVSGQRYSLACRDGEEKRLEALADYVNQKSRTLIDNLGQVGEAHLLLMSALLIADELDECREQGAKAAGADLERLAKTMDKAAAAIEGVAERLEKTS